MEYMTSIYANIRVPLNWLSCYVYKKGSYVNYALTQIRPTHTHPHPARKNVTLTHTYPHPAKKKSLTHTHPPPAKIKVIPTYTQPKKGHTHLNSAIHLWKRKFFIIHYLIKFIRNSRSPKYNFCIVPSAIFYTFT